MASLLKTMVGLEDTVNQKQYLFIGLALALLKYCGEALLYWKAANLWFDPRDFVWPLMAARFPQLEQTPDWFVPAVILWSLPFLWVGVSMSLRRAQDSGLSPWWGLLFFVPMVNLILIGGLCLRPSRPCDNRPVMNRTFRPRQVFFPFVIVIAMAVVGVIAIGLLTLAAESYGMSLFLLLPFLLGLLPSYYFRSQLNMPAKNVLVYVLICCIMILGGMLLVGLEGAICIAMAAPLLLGLALIGALCGLTLAQARNHGENGSPKALLLMLPLLPVYEHIFQEPFQDMVQTEVIIAAPAQKVWQNVVSFADLPPAQEWLFRLGIAAPLRATIVGEGVGAIRRCEFTTGAFVEPITHWQEPFHLGFSVVEQPKPMEELSFYDQIQAPHLHGFFRSRKGEFRLEPLPDGSTRLIGRTWYETDIHPSWYWRIYGRWFIHEIHGRVLNHIMQLSEVT